MSELKQRCPDNPFFLILGSHVNRLIAVPTLKFIHIKAQIIDRQDIKTKSSNYVKK